MAIDELRMIYRSLDRLLEEAGHGAVSRVQTAAGVGESYLRDLRARLAAGRDAGYDMVVLMRMLEALGVDPGTFFGDLYGIPGPVGLCQLETREMGELPEVVAKVQDRLLEQGWQPLPELPQPIRDLDAHCYRDAAEAREIARGDLVKVGAGLHPPSWGVPLLAIYASASRLTGHHDAAQQALVVALELAEPTGDKATLGDLMQRLALVVAERCADHRRAEELTWEAMDCFLQARDLNSVGKTFVDRGRLQYELGEFEEAIRAHRNALEHLEEDEHEYRCAALHGLGVCHRELGDPRKADEYAARARELSPHVSPGLASKLL